MFKFNEFILENLLTELILESKIQFSKDFLGVLNGIGGKVADELKKLHGVDKDLTQNYIDIDLENNNMLTFIQDRRAKQMIEGIEEAYQITSDIHLKHSDFSSTASESSNRIIYARLDMTFEDVNKASEYTQKLKITAETSSRSSGNIYVAYQGIEDETIRGVIKKDRIAPVESEVWNSLWTSSRNAIRAGRLVRSFLTLSGADFVDTDIEEFVNKYKAHIDILNDAFAKFRVVEGDDIQHYYEYENYNLDGNSGTLGSSCMAEVDGSYMDIYSKNPNQCKLIILYDDRGSINGDGEYRSSHIIGRALLWKVDSGEMFMDRIYYNGDSIRDIFKKYAARNNYYTRGNIDWDEGEITIIKGTETKKTKLVVTLDTISGLYDYPYLDSLMYFNADTKKLSCSKTEIDAQWILNGTGGDREEIYDD